MQKRPYRQVADDQITESFLLAHQEHRMKTSLASTLLISIACFTQSFAQAPSQPPTQLTNTWADLSPQSSPAELARKRNRAMAPIKSALDLQNYIKMTPPNLSPLNLLSKAGLAEFLDSLTFNKQGLTGYKFSNLEEELTPTQIYRILALFGSQSHVRSMKNAKIKTEADRRLIEATPASFYGDVWDENSGDPDHYHHYRCHLPATCATATSFLCDRSC